MVKNIDNKELENILKTKSTQWEMIDVREPFEWEEGHIKNAKLIPTGEIVAREKEIDFSKKVLFYCRSGNRSFQVANYFSKQGKNVWNLEGGVLELSDDFEYLVK